MRKIGFLVTGLALLLMAAALVDGLQAQQKKGGFQPGGGGGGGFGFGGFGAPGSATLTLLNNKDVKKELDLTDEQLDKLPAEVLAAVSRVLNEKQFKRFKQIELQQRGNRAFNDATIQSALQLNDEQKKNIGTIIEESNKELAEARKGGGGGFGGGFGRGNNEKVEKINAETKDRILTVLTKTQRKAYREMIGEDFKMSTPTFGGFGKGKDTKKAPNKDQ